MVALIFLLSFIIGFFIAWMIQAFRLKGLIKVLEAEKRLLQEKLLWSEKMQTHFSENFKGLSMEALKHNNESFMQLAEKTFEKLQERSKGELDKKSQAISELIKPVKEALDKFDGKIENLEKARVGAYVGLKEQISSLLDAQKELKLEASNLSRALRAPNVRGRWGEIQLKRVVEMAGMVSYCDFYEQANASTEEGKFRPDLLVKLPGGKNLIVDAKAPLDAYLESIETQDEEKKVLKIKEHAQKIRSHILALSKKSYWEQFQPTPEFVVLFLPGEIFFSAALEQDPSLIEIGVEKKVILATPTTLIALLRAVSYGWKQEHASKNAAEISLLGKELYKRISDMCEHFSKVGKSLSSAVQSYNRSIGSLEARVLPTARKFAELNGDKEGERLEPIEADTRFIRAEEFSDENTPIDG